MSFNLSEISVKLAASFADGTASRLSNQLGSDIRAAVENASPHIQRLGGLLEKSLNIAPQMSEIHREFESLMRDMSKGKFFEEQIKQLDIYHRHFKQVGDEQRRFLAEQAKIISSMRTPTYGFNQVPAGMATFGRPLAQVEANDQVGRIWRHVHGDPQNPDNYTRRTREDQISAANEAAAMQAQINNRRAAASMIGRMQGEEASNQARLAAVYGRTMSPYGPASRYAAANPLGVDPSRVSTHMATFDQMYASSARDQQIAAANAQTAERFHNINQSAAVSRLREVQQAEEVDRTRRSAAYGRYMDPYGPASQAAIANPLGVDPSRVAMHEANFNRRAADRGAAIRQVDAIMAIRDGQRAPRAGFIPGHNLRFGMQNVGFGIDDAIQSYQYGGAAASIRAASNNLTAIAGMTIPNPFLAAGAVIGLSAVTAMAPTMMKNMGWTNPAAENLAKSTFDRYPSRSIKTGKDYQSSASSLFGDITTLEATEAGRVEKLKAAEVFIRNRSPKLKIDRLLEDSWERGIVRQGMNAETAAKFDEALKTIREYREGNSGSITHTQIQAKKEALKQMLLTAGPDSIKAEMLHKATQQIGGRGYRATTLGEYESSLIEQRDLQLAAVNNSRLGPDAKEAERAAIQLRHTEDMAKKTENYQTVMKNMAERRDFNLSSSLANYGRNSILGGVQSGFESRRDQYAIKFAEGQISKAEYDSLSAGNHSGYGINRRRSMEDAQYGALGITNGIGVLNARYGRLTEDYSTDPSLNGGQRAGLTQSAVMAQQFHTAQAMEQTMRMHFGYNSSLVSLRMGMEGRAFDYTNDPFLTQPQKTALLQSNKAGFGKQRADMIESMLDSNQVNNPLGQLNMTFKHAFKGLQDEIAQGGLKPEEAAQLTLNMKQQYANQVRLANIPKGHERFTADSYDVGSREDKEMRTKLLGNFVAPEKNTKIMQMSLEELIKHTTIQQELNSKLELAKVGL